MDRHSLIDLPAFADDNSSTIHSLIESPRGSRIKFKYTPQMASFAVSYILPTGSVFPRDFGFIPSTLERDGDPIDILVLLDAPTFTGCVVPTRVIGAIEAEQTQDGVTFRNDRLVGVATAAHEFARIMSIAELDPIILKEIEHFYISYNDIRGRGFKPLTHSGPETALELIREGIRRYIAEGGRISLPCSVP
jgi:inorganic pyrophosphatase